jgi:nitrite reductase (NO-forming)
MRRSTPAAGWRPANAALAPAPPGAIHYITLTAEDKLMHVAPGVAQDMWTFGGQVPGPTLRGHVGDEFVVTLVNHSPMGHSLDFHAASQPMEAMPTVGPGQLVTERFRANYAGIFLCHCGTAPVLEHVANGMFGAVIIDPPRLPAVSREFLVVQSELYLGPQGQPGDYAKMLRGQPDAVVFNGYVDQYLFAPLRVSAGQRVRIWVLDAGPSDDTSFHVVGTQFDTLFSNGAYLLQPGNPAGGAAQTLDLMPGEGGFAEFTVPAAGQYQMLDHHLDHAAAGAAGYLIASVR